MEADDDLGYAAARTLIDRLRDSGAEQFTVPIIVEDEVYEIVVRHKPVSDRR